jgi:RimJ/RimL family protein N-acetyltransferase
MSYRLRLLRDTDLETVMLWRMKPEVTRYMYTDPQLTLDGQRQWLQRLQQSDRDQVWIIELLDGARPVGLLSLSEIDRVQRPLQLGLLPGRIRTCAAPGWRGRWSSTCTPGCSTCWG